MPALKGYVLKKIYQASDSIYCRVIVKIFTISDGFLAQMGIPVIDNAQESGPAFS